MSNGFRTTRWSLVIAARDGSGASSQQALEELCEAYWYPLYAYVRLLGHDPDEARDLTQAFFARLLEKGYLQDVKEGAGRFRSFLLVALKHFLSKERDKAAAIKRGGQARVISLDTDLAESRYRTEPVDQLDPEAVFERRWAMTVLERAMDQLQETYTKAGKQERFEKLHGFLTGEEPHVPYRQIAQELEINEGAVREAVRRMRQQFGSLLREEIASTVADPGNVDDEVRHLLRASGPR